MTDEIKIQDDARAWGGDSPDETRQEASGTVSGGNNSQSTASKSILLLQSGN